MREMKRRPSLAVSMAASLQSEAEQRGFFAYIPVVLLMCLSAGAGLAYLVPADFWTNDRWDISTAVYAGLLAFNGILMALGWFSFAKIYEILTNGPIGRMIVKHGLLGMHLAFIDITHFVLVGSSIMAVVGLISVLVDAPLWIDRSILAASLGLTGYALARGVSAASMVSELIWEQAQLNKEPPNLAAVSNGARSS